ncbi:hypothetical protein Sste5346_005854 [Sporothrix stenoceras]|uniref:Enoyl reductase (ER) domain-containing protein n=1 Tax=Sporothrix stenoceras TaxID=5173 RepID=A0ABR3Z154_9PEZI
MTTIVQEHPVLSLETAEPSTATTMATLTAPVYIKTLNSAQVDLQEVMEGEPRSLDSTTSQSTSQSTSESESYSSSYSSHSENESQSQAPTRAPSATSLAASTADVSVASTAPSSVADETEYQEEKTVPENPSPAPSTHTALVINAERGYELVADFESPTALAPTEVRIRNKATGLNHIDWMSVAYNFCLPSLPWITGREMAGVVDAVGSDVEKVKVGDAVWTTTYYKDRRAGCFQELVVVPQHTVFPIPETLDFHTAACLGVAGVTAAMTLWQWLNVPMRPKESPEATTTDEMTDAASGVSTDTGVFLIWGGSTVTGQFAIQLAAHAGLQVVAVCSEATADLVRARGATHVVTYTGKTDMHVIGEILCCAAGRLTRAIDLVGARTAKLCLQVIAASGRTAADPVDFAPLAFMSSKDVIPANARVHTVEIKQFVLNDESGVVGERLNELVASGAVLLPAVRVLEGGLAAVEQGLAMVKSGNLDGRKLVVSF